MKTRLHRSRRRSPIEKESGKKRRKHLSTFDGLTESLLTSLWIYRVKTDFFTMDYDELGHSILPSSSSIFFSPITNICFPPYIFTFHPLFLSSPISNFSFTLFPAHPPPFSPFFLRPLPQLSSFHPPLSSSLHTTSTNLSPPPRLLTLLKHFIGTFRHKRIRGPGILWLKFSSTPLHFPFCLIHYSTRVFSYYYILTNSMWLYYTRGQLWPNIYNVSRLLLHLVKLRTIRFWLLRNFYAFA